MALNEDWIQKLLYYEATLAPVSQGWGSSDSGEVGRAWIDGCLVVYDLQDVPLWLAEALKARDDDGNTTMGMERTAMA